MDAGNKCKLLIGNVTQCLVQMIQVIDPAFNRLNYTA